MATIAPVRDSILTFWQKMALGIAAFIIFSFAQFSLRGMVDIRVAPIWIHLHALVMVAWLALFVIQPTLIRQGDIARHRKLGSFALIFAAAVVLLCGFSAVMTASMGRVPPMFTPPFFLALNFISLAGFAGMVVAAVLSARRDNEAHRRYIVGANVLLMEPALGRLLPMPLLAPWGEFVVMLIQLATLAIVARHDLKSLGYVHRATLASLAVVAVLHSLTEMVGRLPAMERIATSLAAG